MTHSSMAIANEFLKRAQAEGRSLTHMHVQKLVYIAHGWHMAINNEPLVDEQFQAWDYGPVLPSLYRALKQYGSGTVPRLLRRGDDTPFFYDDDGDTIISRLNEPERSSIEQVWNEFKDFAAFQLSALTHKEGAPWKGAIDRYGRNAPIANNAIQDYFTQLADQPE